MLKLDLFYLVKIYQLKKIQLNMDKVKVVIKLYQFV